MRVLTVCVFVLALAGCAQIRDGFGGAVIEIGEAVATERLASGDLLKCDELELLSDEWEDCARTALGRDVDVILASLRGRFEAE